MSDLTGALADYLALRRSLGYKLERAGRVLSEFVDYMDDAGAETVTVEAAVVWATLTPNPESSWRAQRLGLVRGFARYLHVTVDQRHQIPPQGLIPRGQGRPAPFLLSHDDVARLMAAARTLSSPLRAATAETFIGMLAVSGLRVAEGIRLDVDDVDVDSEVLPVRDSKAGLLRVAGDDLGAELRGVLTSGDDYASAAKPQIDWDDSEARGQLIDARARDAYACLVLLDGAVLAGEVGEAAELLATVVGQDIEEADDGSFRIIRGVAKDRVISTVDVDARHGRKTSAHRFDGYKGHIAIDPDSEIITDTVVGAANAGDAAAAAGLIEDLVGDGGDDHDDTHNDDTHNDDSDRDSDMDGDGGRPRVYGDAAYGTGEFLDTLANAGIDAYCKTQPPAAPPGRFGKDRFVIDLDADTVTCPNGVTVTIRRSSDGDGIALFADACAGCGLRRECTSAKAGRSVRVGRYEHRLADARRLQHDPGWRVDYRATRPKVERKIGHLWVSPQSVETSTMRRCHVRDTT